MASEPQANQKAKGAKRWILFGLKIAVAAALLYFVATRVTWRDTARPPVSDAAAATRDGALDTAYVGVIEMAPEVTTEAAAARPWDQDRVRFRFDADAVPPADLSRAEMLDGSRLRLLETGPDGWKITPGMPVLLKHMQLGLYLLGASCLFIGISLAALRWWLLLRSANIEFSLAKCFRLTFIGQFFNTVVPGLTGGDLVKAFLVARSTDRRAEAVVSVFVDRILGLFALSMLAGIAVLFVASQQPQLAFGVLAFVGAMLGAFALFFSHGLRRFLRLEERIARLPGGGMLRKVDEAVFVYRYRMGTVGLSLLLSCVNHLVTITGVFVIGVALANEMQRASFSDLLIIYPVVGVMTAVPIAPAGLGIGEGLFGSLYLMFGRSYNIGVLTSIIYRLTFVAWSLLGGIFLITGRERVPTDPLEGEGFAAPAVSAPLPDPR